MESVSFCASSDPQLLHVLGVHWECPSLDVFVLRDYGRFSCSIFLNININLYFITNNLRVAIG